MLRNIIVVGVIVIGGAAGARAAGPELEAPVVGGTRVPDGTWRDVVAVVARDAVCTGTLVAPDIVVTAAHCVEAGPVEVITDTTDYAAEPGDHIPVKWARAYPRWRERYDVGVLMLDHVARGRPRTVASACTTRPALVAGATVHLVGFGLATAEATDANTTLREAELRVVDPTCTSDPSCEPSVAPHGEFIAGGGGRDACFGDSGGPVYLDTADGPALVGIVSRGLAVPGAPCAIGGVYERVDKVVSWIQSVTGTRLARTSCDGPADDADAAAADEAGAGGCAAAPGVSGPAVWLIAIAAIRRRRRARPR